MEIILKLLLIAVTCFRSTCATVKNYRYYPRYHLAPILGWMNDPNGFCVFKGEYHLFYQHNPVSSLVPGTARWRHVKSKDLFHWQDLGIAIQNNSVYDRDGVFSGSAVVDSGVMHLFYTGHVKHPGQTPNQTETQELAISEDGIHVTKYAKNPIISRPSLGPNFRDPKVWKHGRDWYMVLGNSFIGDNGEQLGRILLFKSLDGVNWSQGSIVSQSDGYLGYMWECPDLFEINGRFVLLFSPQGVKRDGDRFKNLYQTGYIVGNLDYDTHVFTPLSEFRTLDFGHDFYATQTILDNYGRRLLIGWMDMWERSYPEGKDGFRGQMTLIRTLSLTKDHRIIQRPVKEAYSVRGKLLFAGNSRLESTVVLPNKAGEVNILASSKKDFVMYIGNETYSVEIKYEYESGRVSLRRDNTDDGLRRTVYRPLKKLTLRVFIDASSIEVFFGDGEVVFSSRFFVDSAISVRVDAASTADMFTVYDMKTTLYTDKSIGFVSLFK